MLGRNVKYLSSILLSPALVHDVSGSGCMYKCGLFLENIRHK